MIRGIIFDCFGVLYQGSVTHLREYAAEQDLQALADLNLSSDYGYISRDEYLAQVGELIHKSPEEIEALTRAAHIRNDVLVEYVKTLRSTYKVAMLSNVGRGLIEQLFTPDELKELFDVVVLSNEVGMIKPDPNIYLLTSEKMGLQPYECVMIDDLVVNIDGAERAGMKGIVYTTTSSLSSDIENMIAG